MLEPLSVAEVEAEDTSLVVVAEVVPVVLVVPGSVALLVELVVGSEPVESLEPVLAEAETLALAENSALSESAGSVPQAETMARGRCGSKRGAVRIFERDDSQPEGSLSRSGERRSSVNPGSFDLGQRFHSLRAFCQRRPLFYLDHE